MKSNSIFKFYRVSDYNYYFLKYGMIGYWNDYCFLNVQEHSRCKNIVDIGILE